MVVVSCLIALFLRRLTHSNVNVDIDTNAHETKTKHRSELFVTYGENYFSEWLDDPTKPVIPNNAAYRNAKSVLTKLVAVLYRAVRTSAETKAVIGQETKTINEISDIWDSVTDPSHEDFDLAKDLLDVLDSMAWTHRSVFLETMPKTPEQIPEVYKNGLKHRDFKRSQRSIEELQEIGVCMDNIEEGLSTIPHAGRGGFARRNLTQGTVVTPIPLLHFGDRSFYDMYPGSQTVEGYIPDRRGSPIHQQLIVNYCFGHKQSTLLLCHYGSGAGMINHSKKKANVRLQWLSVPGGSPEWRDMALSEWTATKKAGIVMELVATRDIAAGEEILMDYGDDWADAFSRHVANWKPPPEAAWYRPADELNDDPDVIVRTQQEGGYDWFLDLYCRNYYRQAQFLAPSSTVLHRCHVTERRWTPNGYRYTAVIFDFDDLEEDELQCQLVGTTEILFDVPRDAFVFDDTMYSRDHQQPWAFRHPIGIPDYMMPEAWKNLE